jgi:hypothetical protein
MPTSRRRFLRQSAGAAVGLGLGSRALPGLGESRAHAQLAGARPPGPPAGVAVKNPRDRVPVSLIIDDSTCLVNLAHFCIPQFHEVFPNQYPQPWKTLPREIPDAFVRRFGEWSLAHGIKGKYSVIPHPACVGWLDRDLPGWSKSELNASLALVRELMAPSWDIHPEMVSHTWVIDTRTGRPYAERTADFMENWGWSAGKSADELAQYMSYALRVLKNVGFVCEGITTPGGFGTRALPALAQGTLAACRDVFGAEVPHYFRHLYTDDHSVAPRVEYAAGLDGPRPECVVSIIGCTGDWFGGWDGLTSGSVDQFITADLKGGRLPAVIARNEPAVLVCHWPGIYFNGQEIGFQILRDVVRRLHAAFDHLHWMKLSEIARYWAARELTRIEQPSPGVLKFHAPFACPQFTLELSPVGPFAPGRVSAAKLTAGGNGTHLSRVSAPGQLQRATYCHRGETLVACFDLPKGPSQLELAVDRP